MGAATVRHAYNASQAPGGRAGRPSFTGGLASFSVRPTGAARRLQDSEHPAPLAEQMAHERTALTIPTQRYSAPHPAPLVAAAPRPSAFTMPGIEHEHVGVDAAMRRPQPGPQMNRAAGGMGARSLSPRAELPRSDSPQAEPRGRGR